MWKKALIVILGIVGTFSVAYMDDHLRAADHAYRAGGNVTGRINIQPANLNVVHSGIQKGDKLTLGVKNPENGNELGWIVLGFHTKPSGEKVSITGTTEVIAHSKPTSTVSASFPTYNTLYKESAIKTILSQFNQQLQRNPTDVSILQDRLTDGMINIKNLQNQYALWFPTHSLVYNATATNNYETGKVAYTFFHPYDTTWRTTKPGAPNNGWLEHPGGITINDLVIGEDYWDGYQGGHLNPDVDLYRESGTWSSITVDGARRQTNGNTLLGVRAGLNLALQDQVVFGVSQGTNTALAIVDDSVLSASYTYLYQATLRKSHMKLRIQHTELTATTQLQGVVNRNGEAMSIANRNSTVYLKASAKAGNDGNGGVNTVSVLVFSEDGAFSYYKPLESAKGTGTYAFDTAGLPIGTYQLAIVNEVYNEASTATAYSSNITNAVPLEIADIPPLSNLAFTGRAGLTYGQSSVIAGTAIGTISSRNGSGTPRYTLKADPAYPNDLQHFEIGPNGSTVNVRGNALEAGTYHFIIEAQDGTGEPETPLQILASITVNKADPSLRFHTQEPIHKIVGDPMFTEGFTHSNTEASDPHYAVRYSSDLEQTARVAGGEQDNEINIYPGMNDGTAMIRVELAETKNYRSASAALTVHVHPKLSAAFSSEQAEFTTNEIAAVGTPVGTVALAGNSPPYEFTMGVDSSDPDASADNALFRVRTIGNTANTSTELLINAPNLSQGAYKFTVKVTDAYGQSTYAKGQIIVSGSIQAGFNFLDEESNEVLTNGTMRIAYGTDNARLLARGGQGAGAITYGIKAGEPADVFTLDSQTGEITAIHKLGSVMVEATKAGDEIYRPSTITMRVEITAGLQELSFDPMIPSNKRFVSDAFISVPAILTRADGTNGAITYTSTTPAVCVIEDANTAQVKMVNLGTCQIKAENNEQYYEQVSAVKTIQLYAGITGSLVQVIDPLHQGDFAALAGSTDVIARVTGLAGGDGTFTFLNLHAEASGIDQSERFALDRNGNILAQQNLRYGTYEITVTVADGHHETSQIIGTIDVGLEGNDQFRLVNEDAAISEIISDYVTAQNPRITLTAQGRKGTGAIHYRITQDSHKDPSKQNDAISVEESTGVISVHRAMTNDDVYRVYAYVDEDVTNGYARQITPSVSIQIDRSPQTITFDSTIPSSMRFQELEAFPIGATLNRADGTITYSSTTPSVCTVADSSQPVAVMIHTGICSIQAQNLDENYMEESKIKTITLYDGMTARFTQVISPLRQGDAALNPDQHAVIGKISSLAGNQGDVSYTLKAKKQNLDASDLFTINDHGEVLPLQQIPYGTYELEITLMDDTGEPGKILVTGTLIIDLETNDALRLTYQGVIAANISESYTNASNGMSVGVVGKKGSKQVHYRFSDASHKDPNQHSEALLIHDDGTITVNRTTTEDDLYQIIAYVDEDSIHGYARQETPPVPIIITDAAMPQMQWLVDGVASTQIQTGYIPNGRIQLGVDQAPAGSTIKYSLVEDGTGHHNGVDVSDVVSVNETTGEVTILHANQASQLNQVQLKATVSCVGYQDSELPPLPVLIEKAEQSDFRFVQQVYLMPYGSGSFTPAFLNGAPHDDGVTFNYRLSCTEPYDVRVHADTPDTFTYNVTEPDGAMITIKARNLGNRDYLAKEATATLKVLGEHENLFDITVHPSPVILYGENVSVIADIEENADITYTYESMDESILKQDEAAPNQFISQKTGTAQLKVTKHERGAADSTVYVSIRVNPKPITIELEGAYEIKTGEAIPEFTLKDVSDQLVNGDVLPNPEIKVFIQNTLTPGTYPIEVTYPNDDRLRHYRMTLLPCDLIIKQDEPLSQWYKVYLQSDGTKAQSDLTKWVKEPLMIESIHSEYDQVSFNGQANWNPTLRLDQEGSITHTVYFKNSRTNAFSSSANVTTSIDYTKPIVKSITGTIVNEDGLWGLIHDLTFGSFFQPKTSVIFTVEDPKQDESMAVSGVAKILYKVYIADRRTDTLKPLITDGRITTNDIRDGKAAIVLNDPGDYYICGKAMDHAGNEGMEVCSYLNIKGIGFDSDGDGIPDLNIDLDDDGEADLNITRKDCKEDEIGVTARCSIPYTNIDTNGNGTEDTNIDTNGDGEPDINIGIVHEWHPYTEVDFNKDGKVDYKTGAEIPWELNIDSDQDRKPDINIDIDKNGIADINIDTDNDFSKPEINIDNVGDGKPHINMDDNEDGKPDRNIVVFTKWEPNDDVEQGLVYDTMLHLKANDTLIHPDTDIIVQSPPDNAFLPKYALKVEDQTKKQADLIKEELGLTKAQRVKQVYRISIVDDQGNETEIHDVITVKIPVSDEINNPIFYMKQSDGALSKLHAVKRDGYYEFQTEGLGLISIIAEEKAAVDTTDPEIPKKEPVDQKPSTSVQGAYQQNSQYIGGAYTADSTEIDVLMLSLYVSMLGMMLMLYKKRKHLD